MKMIILIGLLLSVITVEPKSIQREKAAGNTEKRARQMDQGPASFEADENEEADEATAEPGQAEKAATEPGEAEKATDFENQME